MCDSHPEQYILGTGVCVKFVARRSVRTSLNLFRENEVGNVVYTSIWCGVGWKEAKGMRDMF